MIEFSQQYDIKIDEPITLLNTSKSAALLTNHNKSNFKVLDHEETKNESIAMVRYETTQHSTPAKTLLKPIINA